MGPYCMDYHLIVNFAEGVTEKRNIIIELSNFFNNYGIVKSFL